MVIFPAIQGLCAATNVPSSYAIIATLILGRLYLSSIACVHSVAYVLGLVIGCAVVQSLLA
jgi:hypothetical protein